MVATFALSLVIAPAVTGRLAAVLPVDGNLTIGTANCHGIVLRRLMPIGHVPKKSFTFMVSPNLKDGRYFLSNSGWLARKLPDGALVGNQRFDCKGHLVGETLNLGMIEGINSKGDMVGRMRDSQTKTDRAAVVVNGKLHILSYPPEPGYISPTDYYDPYSSAYDIGDKGRILLSSLPKNLVPNRDNPRSPFIIEDGVQKALPNPFENADIFALRFAFDGSIVGFAYSYSHALEPYNPLGATAFLRWKRSDQKPQIVSAPDDQKFATMPDASGAYIVSSLEDRASGNVKPTLWLSGKITELKVQGKVLVDSYLGFVKADTVACLGDVNGKWSVFTIALPKPKSSHSPKVTNGLASFRR